LIAGLPAACAAALGRRARTGLEQTTFGLGRVGQEREGALVRSLEVVASKNESSEARLAAVRVIQLALGDVAARTAQGMVWEGYSPRQPARRDEAAKVAAILRSRFPSGNADLDREVSRTLALLEDEDAATFVKVASRLTPSSDPLEDIHDLIV